MMGKSLHPVFYTLLFLILFVSAPTYAQERTGDLAVLDVRAGTKLPAEINLALLSQIVREEAVKATSYRVMTKENIFAILQDKGIDTSKCADVECEVQYGRVLQADKLVVGEVNLVGSTYYLSLNLYDTPSAAIDKSITKECERCTFRQLVAQVREAAKGLFGVAVGREAPGAEQKWEAEEVEAETVQFESEPPGATVEIGKKPACETPCSQRLQAGVYRVAMRKPRYLPYEERVTVKKGMDPVAARLEPTFGWLTITSEPAGAEIVINGKKVGATPIQDMETDPGNYEIVAHSAGHIDARKKIVLARGKRQEIALTLQLVKAEPSLGWLTVKSTPSGFSVFVDGNVVGSTPVEEIEVSPGEHEVAVRGARYYEAKKKVIIRGGERQDMALTLRPREGEIKVSAVDEKGNALEGEVSLDGTEVGRAPGTYTAMIGEHEVEVRGPGGMRWRGTVNVEEKQTRTMEAKFRTREEQAITRELPSAIEERKRKVIGLFAHLLIDNYRETFHGATYGGGIGYNIIGLNKRIFNLLAIGAQASAGELNKFGYAIRGKTLIMQLYSIFGVNLLGRTEKWNLDAYVKPSITYQEIEGDSIYGVEFPESGDFKTGVRGEAGLSLIRWPFCLFIGYFYDKTTMGVSYSVGVYF